MDSIEIVLERMQNDYSEQPAFFWQGQTLNYPEFLEKIDSWSHRLGEYGIGCGTICSVLGDYSPETCALFFALMKANSILIPFTHNVQQEMPALMKIAGTQHLISFNTSDSWVHEVFDDEINNEIIEAFREEEKSGLIVFTSGSTGKPKGILHDCERVMRKFISQRDSWRTVLFLMMDHFGGFNTLLSTFAYGGMGVCLTQRTPEAVCQSIEQARATLLPTTPTFLNLLIASGSYRDFDLSSIRMITYGTEVMPEATLLRIRQVFPNAQIKQTYGLSELGVLRSRSESGESVWVKVGGEGFEVKVVDNVLWVRSEANMVGYLNSPNPFDEEGWMCTGDEVEVKGDYIRFLGRKSEMINVGGQKVFPVEVENVLLQDKNIRETTVYGVIHPLMGQLVHARVTLFEPEDLDSLSIRLRKLCLSQLAKYKVPVRFVIVSGEDQFNERFKKVRKGLDEQK